jgi:hypothetical protein
MTLVEPKFEKGFKIGVGEVDADKLARIGATRTRAQLQALGIDFDQQVFQCPLPGHERHTAQAVKTDLVGYWVIACDQGRRYGLANVRAMRAADSDKLRLGEQEAARWLELLSHEAGLLEPLPVDLGVSDDDHPTIRHVAEHIELMLGLRAAANPEREGMGIHDPFTFTRAFCQVYCEVSERLARDAIKAFQDGSRGIERIERGEQGNRRRPDRWRLA